MNCAARNAARLLADARVLADAKRFPTAASLAALSIEESGKVVILRRFLTASDGDTLKNLWREYRSHTSKNIHWIMPELVASGGRKLVDFLPMVDGLSNHPELLDAMKQLGFYTDCLGAAVWSEPQLAIDESLCRKLISAAEILLSDREVSTQELELWKKHLLPVWNDYPKMQDAVIAWYAEMQASGLMPAGANLMERFIQHGLTPGQASKLKDDA